MDFTVPVDLRVKIKEMEKRDKYQDLARERRKKLWDMKVTVIPTVIDALVKTPKGLVKGVDDLEIWGKVETIQTKALRSATILRRVLKTQ